MESGQMRTRNRHLKGTGATFDPLLLKASSPPSSPSCVITSAEVCRAAASAALLCICADVCRTKLGLTPPLHTSHQITGLGERSRSYQSTLTFLPLWYWGGSHVSVHHHCLPSPPPPKPPLIPPAHKPATLCPHPPPAQRNSSALDSVSFLYRPQVW